MIIALGDKIRISVELLALLYEQPGHVSEIVEVRDIFEDGDVKILALATTEKR